MTSQELPNDLISLKEAAVHLGLRDERTVRRALERHGLAVVNLGRCVRVERSALAALIDAARTPAPGPPKNPSVEVAKNRVAEGRLPHRAATMTNPTAPNPGQPRRGWRQSFPGEPGLYRLHRVDCAASPKHKRQPKCTCRFYCHHPTGTPGKTSLRRLDARDLNAAKLEKKRVQGAGSSLAPAGISPTLTVKQFFEQVYLAGKLLNKDTERNYKSRFNHDLASRIGNKRMRDVTNHDINTLVKELEGDMEARRVELGRPNPRHVENRLTVIKSIFRYAHDISYIPKNPTAGVTPPKGTDRERGEADPHDAKRILTDEQGELLSRWLRTRISEGGVDARKAMGIALGQFLALRNGEARGACWFDFDLGSGVFCPRRQWKGGEAGFARKKTDDNRQLRIPRPLLELLHLLRLHEEERPDFSTDDALVYIFDPTRPMSGTTLRNAFFTAQKELGIAGEDGRPLRFHALRHTAATAMIRRDVPIAKVAAFLGHSSPKVTFQVYMHLYAPDLEAAADAIAAAFGGSEPDASSVGTPQSLDEFLDDLLGDESQV